jgi:hypothetical protein
MLADPTPVDPALNITLVADRASAEAASGPGLAGVARRLGARAVCHKRDDVSRI